MSILKAEYIASYPNVQSCPKTDKMEFAFIGRSNVGKSSLINMLTHKKALAKVSNTPGKTQMLNYFNIDDQWHLVDLPGYGYARVSKGQKQAFSKMILNYLEKRENLVCSFLLLDIRLPLQKIDRDFMIWMGEKALPFAIIFTKSDKLSPLKIDEHRKTINASILESWTELPTQFVSSAVSKTGKDDILGFIRDTISQLQ